MNFGLRRGRRRGHSLLVMAIGLLLVSGCGEEPPVKIGFVGGLSGRVSDLGVAGRDGAMLAVEECNQAGGIAGRKVALVVKDDRQDQATAERVVRELIDEQVLAIIGHMTSSMTMVTVPMTDAAGVVMLSPTSKTEQLSNRDDNFFRFTPQLSRNAELLADYIIFNQGVRRIAVLYDSNNSAFTADWLQAFKRSLELHKGEIVTTLSFASSPETGYLALAGQALERDPQGLLILASAIDTAMLAQQVRKLGSEVPLYSSEWGFTGELLSFGGRAVEGMASFHSFNAECTEPGYREFRERFEQRFGYQSSFATVLAYDATAYLLKALERNPHREGLKATLLGLGTFPGLQSDFRLNQYGDVDRRLFLTVVKDGRFTVVDLP